MCEFYETVWFCDQHLARRPVLGIRKVVWSQEPSLYTWNKSDFILSPDLAQLWVDKEISIIACWLFGESPEAIALPRAVQRATLCVTKSKPRFQSQFAFPFRNALDPKERSKSKLEFPFVQLGLSAVWRWTLSGFIRGPEPRGLHQHPLPWILARSMKFRTELKPVCGTCWPYKTCSCQQQPDWAGSPGVTLHAMSRSPQKGTTRWL